MATRAISQNQRLTGSKMSKRSSMKVKKKERKRSEYREIRNSLPPRSSRAREREGRGLARRIWGTRAMRILF
ncbi:MAG: hypothetical protein QF573_06525 [Chloroflexota bacterium]|nr:hypothetical protein [Chloroflexota bacterium]